MANIGDLLIPLLGQLIGVISPQLKKYLHGLVKELYKNAKGTQSQIDDIFVQLLAGILDVDLKD